MNHSAYSSNPSALTAEACSLPTPHGIPLIATNALVCVIGSLGNLLVCLAVASNPNLRRSSNFLLVSLAVADLIATLICEPLFLDILVKRTFYNNCARGAERTYFYISNFSAAASVVHMSAISIDRFIAIVFPFRHKTFMQTVGIKALLIASWSLTTVLFIMGKYLHLPDQAKAFLNLSIFVFCYAVIIVSYSLIVVSLAVQKRVRNQLSAQSVDAANCRYEVRVATTLGIVIVVFTACWFPLFAFFAAAGKPLIKRYGQAHFWIRTTTLSNSAMNFLIYGSRMRNFSETYLSIFKKIISYSRASLFESRRVGPHNIK